MGWWRFAIQAKKLDSATRRYDGLGAQGRCVTLQMDLLQQYAQANRAIPLYCFYNYIPNMRASETSAAWHCCEATPDERQLGCTLTSFQVIEQASAFRGRRNFKWIHQRAETLPWRCLVKCARIRSMYQIEDTLFRGDPRLQSGCQSAMVGPRSQNRPTSHCRCRFARPVHRGAFPNSRPRSPRTEGARCSFRNE